MTAAFKTGWIYGPAGHPAVIHHTDGHAALREWRKERLARRLLEFVTRNAKLVRDSYGLGHYGRIY